MPLAVTKTERLYLALLAAVLVIALILSQAGRRDALGLPTPAQNKT